MAKPENNYIGRVNLYLRPLHVHFEKMHNRFRGGTADSWYSGEKSDLWIEYKYIKRIPIRSLIVADLSSLQKRWLKHRYHEGRKVWVVIGMPGGGLILKTPAEWEDEIDTANLPEKLLSYPLMAAEIFDVTGASPCLLKESSTAQRE